MDLTPKQLEELVVKVVGEILTSSASPRSQNSASSSPVTAKLAAVPAEKLVDSAVAIQDAVITADLLRERLNGKKHVRIGAKAVLTPSARDFLRTSNISCVRGDQSAKSATNAGRWQIIVSSSTPAIEGAVAAVRHAGNWEQKISGTAEEAAKLAIGTICRGEAAGVVVISKAPEVVACLSNRNDKIRAAVVGCVKTVEAARRKIGANVIAIHPGTKGSFELRNMLKAFAASLPVPPAGW